MNGFKDLTYAEMQDVNGGAFEIYVAGKVFTGLAAFGVAGVAVGALIGVVALGWYVTSKN